MANIKTTTSDKDPSTEQTAAGLANTKGLDNNLRLTSKEKSLLRELAKKVKELSERDIEKVKADLWTKHNDLGSSRPLIFCDPENGWNEIITQKEVLCQTPIARIWEMTLRKEIFWGEQMKDDRVIEPYFNIPYSYEDTGYGLSETTVGGENGGSFIYLNPIKDYSTDMPKLVYPEIKVEEKKTKQVYDLATEIFSGILDVRIKGVWWWTLGMTWDFIKLRGLENMMVDMVMEPHNVNELMDFLCSTIHKKLDFLEENELLSLNTEGSYVGSGGFGWTSELPVERSMNRPVGTMDMWGFAESQETVGISPEMFAEFILPHQLTILERFGLNCYGCCEPLEQRWEYIRKIPRLRRVSVSPWANVKKMAEYLGKEYVLSLKPSPTPLSFSNLDEEIVRRELKDKINNARDCNIEVIMKDNHTLGKNPYNAVRWCEIAREEIEKL